jgi:tetratricopeptide (TPR) repeat protein
MKEEGRSSDVIQECLKALSIYPDDTRLRKLLAESYLEAGFIGQAEAELARVTSDISHLISAYKIQAKIYTQQKRVEEAVDALKRYLSHRPEDQEALDLLAKVKPAEQEPVPEGPEIAKEVPLATEEEGHRVTEPATPSLTESYYDEAYIRDAISTYENVLLDNPDDMASAERLAELKALAVEQKAVEMPNEDNLRARKEKMISILEEWLARIQELNHT